MRLLTFAALALPAFSFAWSGDGHQQIADIAWTKLTPAVRAKVEKMLAIRQELGVEADETGPNPQSILENLEQNIMDMTATDWDLRAAIDIESTKVMPVFKMVDTCAGEFESRTPYYYGTFEQEDDAPMTA